MKGLLGTSAEVKIRIFEILNPQDIRTCQLVCRAFYGIIASSSQIQYILILDSLGYCLPDVPRRDMSVRQKVEFLERHRRQWLSPSSWSPTKYLMGSNQATLSQHRLHGGVYACPIYLVAHERGGTSGTVGVHFYQFPSLNMGLESREWKVSDPELAFHGYTFDADQDLLVLIAAVNPARSWFEGCRIYLKTMSQYFRHPKAALPIIPVTFACTGGAPGPSLQNTLSQAFTFSLTGNVLAILFRTSRWYVKSCVIVWDWKRGVEVTRIFTNTFTLLSDHELLLSKSSRAYLPGDDGENDTFGSLDVYIFDPQSLTSRPPYMRTSFLLPRLPTTSVGPRVSVAASHPEQSMWTHKVTLSRPRVYAHATRSQVVTVSIGISEPRDDPSSPTTSFRSGNLCVPVHVLRSPREHIHNSRAIYGAVGNDEMVHVPWAAWGHLSFWAGRSEFRGCGLPANGLHGQRTVEFAGPNGIQELGSNGVSWGIELLDFDRRRVEWTKSGQEGIVDVCIGPATNSEHSLKVEAFPQAQSMCTKVSKRGQYVCDSNILASSKVLVDDERVIIQHLERSEGGAGATDNLVLEVYAV